MELDKKDWLILEALQLDARQSLAALGKRIGLSQPAMSERVRKLEEAGVIEGYSDKLIMSRATLPRLLLPLALTLAASTPHAATIYFCKAYSGGTFWSSAPCSQQKATLDRMVTVPDNMPFELQVQLGEQARQEALRLVAPSPGSTGNSSITTGITQGQTFTPGQGQDKATECKALAGHITALDAMARQPQSGQMQDWITAEKRRSRDRQFQLRC